METDKEITEILEQDFSVLNENNKKNVIEMTKFLILTQNTIVPGFLEEKEVIDILTPAGGGPTAHSHHSIFGSKSNDPLVICYRERRPPEDK
jgi:hypothetical protein